MEKIYKPNWQTSGYSLSKIHVGDKIIWWPAHDEIGTGWRTERWYRRFHCSLRYPFWKWFPMPLYKDEPRECTCVYKCPPDNQ